MSHFTAINLQVRDRDSIVEAMKILGFDVLTDNEGLALKGWGDHDHSSPNSRYFAPKCQIVAKYPRHSHDIGFHLQEDGTYKAYVYVTDVNAGLQWNKLSPKFKQEYGVAQAQKTAMTQGMRIHRENLQDGRVKLTLQPMQVRR